MQQIYDATGIEHCKLTHHRTSALQYAGFNGLNPHQVHTLTKHLIEKIMSAYQSEAEKETLKVMAGFEKNEPYFVPRSLLQLPYPILWYVQKLLPNYTTWVQQQSERNGDKSSCGKKFIHDLIPYLIEVLVQDGVFFTRDFPNHEVSHYLKVCTYVCFCNNTYGNILIH